MGQFMILVSCGQLCGDDTAGVRTARSEELAGEVGVGAGYAMFKLSLPGVCSPQTRALRGQRTIGTGKRIVDQHGCLAADGDDEESHESCEGEDALQSCRRTRHQSRSWANPDHQAPL